MPKPGKEVSEKGSPGVTFMPGDLEGWDNQSRKSGKHSHRGSALPRLGAELELHFLESIQRAWAVPDADDPTVWVAISS